MTPAPNRLDDPIPAPPLGGADIELANFLTGVPGLEDTCTAAARVLLAEIEGIRTDRSGPAPGTWGAPARAIASSSWSSWSHAAGGARNGDGFNPQDWFRTFLPENGGCVYIDLGHTEICVPEVTGARDFVRYREAMLQIVRRAQVAAQARLPAGARLHVIVNSSDGRGHAYGAHLDFLIRREAFEAIFQRQMQLALWLASFQASAVVLTGQGKVGSENGRPDVDFQIGQRADFFDMTTGGQTTFRRPLVNLRDEAHADPRWARVHVICHDASCQQTSTYLAFGTTQIVLAMLAAGAVDPRLILDDPVEAIVAWSHDPDLGRTRPTFGGERLGAVDHQQRICDAARRFVADGRCRVPEAEHLLDTWDATLADLRARAWAPLARRLDWVLKRVLLESAIAGRPGLSWAAPEIKCLDHLYGSLDPDEGLYLACRADDAVDRLVDDAAVAAATTAPPPDTRAWTRSLLLRLAGRQRVEGVSWERVRLRDVDTRPARRAAPRTVELPDPAGLTRAEVEPHLRPPFDLEDVVAVIDRLGADDDTVRPT